MIREVEIVFDNFISETFKSKPEILKFFLENERKAKCLENLCYQIRLCELGSKTFDSAKYTSVIKGVARMFCDAVLEAKTQDLLSINEKQRRMANADEYTQLMKEISEGAERVESL